jgi:cysteine-rich repeat protein
MQLQTRPLTKRLLCFGVLGVSALPGCAEDERPVITVTESASAPVPAPDEACAGKSDGEACGDERLCLAELCVPSTCGDGIEAAGEDCDDGNAAVGDGCTPACTLEYTLCPAGEYVLAGAECPGESGEEPAPVDAGFEGTCPAIFLGSAVGGESSRESNASINVLAKPGETVELHLELTRRRRPEDGWFVWRWTRTKGGIDLSTGASVARDVAYDEVLASRSTASNSFTCPVSGTGATETYYVIVTLIIPGCPPPPDFEFNMVCASP